MARKTITRRGSARTVPAPSGQDVPPTAGAGPPRETGAPAPAPGEGPGPARPLGTWELRVPRVLFGGALVVLVAGMGSPFRLDDLPGLIDNTAVRSLAVGEAVRSFGPFRITPGLLAMFQARGGGTVTAHNFHLLNYVLAVACALVSGQVLARVATPDREARRPLAAAGAALCLSHPLYVQPTLYVFQRSILLVMLGAVLAAWAALAALDEGLSSRARLARAAGAGAGLALAVTSKEIGGPLAAALAGVVGWVALRQAGAAGPRAGRWLLLGAGGAAVGAIGVVVASPGIRQALALRLAGDLPWDFWRVQTASVWRYLELVLVPPWAPYSISHAARDPGGGWIPLVAGILLLAAGGAAVARWSPLVGFALLWAPVSLAPALLVPGAAVVDYKAFPAVLCWAALVLALTGWLSDRGIPRIWTLGAAWLLAAIPSAVFVQDWLDDVALWTRAVSIEPSDPQSLVGLGEVKERFGDLDEAGRLFAAAASSDRARAARGEFEPAPVQHIALLKLGNLAAGRGDSRGALAAWSEALRLDPGFGAARFNLGLGLLVEGKRHQSFAEVSRALYDDQSDASRAEQWFTLLNQRPDVGGAFLDWLDGPAGTAYRPMYEGLPGLRDRVAKLRERATYFR